MSTGIEWTDETWNPVTGYDRVSPGCAHCYAETIANRFAGTKAFPNGFAVTLHPERLDQPLHWWKPRRVFVNSMSDLFHPEVPDQFIAEVLTVMALCQKHTFQVLTKRPQRMAKLLADHGFWTMVGVAALARGVWPPERGVSFDAHALPNVWLGVSVENQRYADLRIPWLLRTPAAVRFLSCEPLLGPIDLGIADHRGHKRDYVGNYDYVCLGCSTEDRDARWFVYDQPLDWVIVGGESGAGARRMDVAWALSLRDQCAEAHVPFFFKQWGGRSPKANGRVLDGRVYDESPARVGDVGTTPAPGASETRTRNE